MPGKQPRRRSPFTSIRKRDNLGGIDGARSMRILLLLTACAALAGCQSDSGLSQDYAKGCGVITSATGQCAARLAQREAADDAKCRGYGAQPATDAYVKCRIGLDQIRATNEAAASTAAATRRANSN